MKFSVLLPTRNRLELLRYAIESVRRQEIDDAIDWEVVVSDNASEEDIAGYVKSLSDPRVRYLRTEEFLSVTDNWNNALRHCTGDYVIMLGDDDCLLPGYFVKVNRLIADGSRPDCIYGNALLYAYPDVLPEWPRGLLFPYAYGIFSQPSENSYWLERDVALKLVQDSMNLRATFGYNMQFSTVSRAFIESLSPYGAFFQSPFPDYYATNVIFLKAKRILVCQHPLVVIGISAKSYGFFYSNHREEIGMKFLNGLPSPEAAKMLAKIILPGTNINTSWVFSMESICANFGAEYPLRISYRRYRMFQIIHCYKNYYVNGRITREQLCEVKRHMKLSEKLACWILLVPFYIMARLFFGPRANRAAARLDGWLGQFANGSGKVREGTYNNILEVFDASKTWEVV